MKMKNIIFIAFLVLLAGVVSCKKDHDIPMGKVFGVNDGEDDVPMGAINGLFSVSASQKVYFSQGNLQYQASTNTWRFAENQWDFVGCQTPAYGEAGGTVDGSDNINISPTYSGWIDLFGWGTSGWDSGNTYFHPWDFLDMDDFSMNLFGPPGPYDLTDTYSQADWGVYNPISNGGNTAGLWHTLTESEWNYVFNLRNTVSGIRYAMAQINCVNGVILLPDDWSESIYPFNNTNVFAGYSSNVINASQWETLQNNGVVFLPAAGQGKPMYGGYGEYGFYWSASYYDGKLARIMSFAESSGSVGSYGARSNGFTVRLVCHANQVSSYTITAFSNPTNGGMITGAGTYTHGQFCTMQATARSGYTFVNWTENGNQVSTSANYGFTVISDCNLVANFQMAPTGAIGSPFSISSTRQVWFSQGNLQYIGSANTPYWKFTDNQWDYLGTTTGQNSTDQNVDRDLFGWGTSGWNNGNAYYKPWDVQYNNIDSMGRGYGPTDGSVCMYDLIGAYSHADWGVHNAISNGGNVAGQWRTLSSEEWGYVFVNRNTASGILYAKAQVNSINGVILLPDNWSESTLVLNNTNTGSTNYSSNVISTSQWSVLEKAGAIFLPATGQRLGTWIQEGGDFGGYWSTSCTGSNRYARGIMFDEDSFGFSQLGKEPGLSVRLVCDVK